MPGRSVFSALFALCIAFGPLAMISGAADGETPVKGGTLVVALDADPATLNGAVNTSLQTTTVSPQILSVLLRMNPKGELIPELADSWTMSADGLTYTFKLHPGVKWHDGKPFTSDDVKFSLETDRKYNGVASGGLAALDAIQNPDPLTVILKLKFPFPPLLKGVLAGANTAVMLPKHLYDTGDPLTNPFNLKPVGTGAFVFKEWVKGDHITLERNPDYFRSGLPYVDRLIFKIIPDASARVAALQKGEVDVLPYYTVPTLSVPELQKSPGVTVVIDDKRPVYSMIHSFFNLRNQYLKVKAVRQGIAYAIDRKVIVEKGVGGLGTVGTSPISSQQKELYDPTVNKYAFDLAKANQLLDQGGFPKKADGTRFSLKLVYQRGAEAGALDAAADIMREQLKAVGITLELQPLDAAAWNNAAYVTWDFDLTFSSIGTGPAPSIGLHRLYLSTNIKPSQFANNSGYSNPRIDQLFELGAKELDQAKSVAIYKEVQQILVEDLPSLWLWEKVAPIAFRSTVRGFPSGPFHWESYDSGWTGPLSAATPAPGSAPSVTTSGPAPLVVVLIVGAAALGLFGVGRMRRKA